MENPSHQHVCACVWVREVGGEGENKENWWERMRLLLGPWSFGFVLNLLSLRMGVILLQAAGLLEVPKWLECQGPAAGWANGVCTWAQNWPTTICLFSAGEGGLSRDRPLHTSPSRSTLSGSKLCAARPCGSDSLPCRWTHMSPQPCSSAGHRLY